MHVPNPNKVGFTACLFWTATFKWATTLDVATRTAESHVPCFTSTTAIR